MTTTRTPGDLMYHARHRRPQRFDAARRTAGRLTAVLAFAAAAIGLLYAVPKSADASSTAAATSASGTYAQKMTDYGSGPWGGIYSAPVRTGDPATADVLMMGDSIGNRCASDVRTALAAKGMTLATISQSGQNTAGLVSLLLSEPKVPSKVFMEAGTNDVFNPPAMPVQIARAQTWAADNSLELFWGDTYVGRPAYAAADARNSGWVNSFIYASIPYDHVIKWQPALAAAVGRGRALNYYLEDGVHPWANTGTTPYNHGDGCAFYAAVVAGGIS
jgi:hypothetical protein